MSPTAFKHGVETVDILHAINHARIVEEVGDDPIRYLILGPSAAGAMLEIVVLDSSAGPMVIHAMTMRTKYERLLTEGEVPYD
jgi:hypothetical protein